MLRKIVEVNGDTLVIPELKNFQGERVEIILRKLSARTKSSKNLKGFFGKLKANDDGLAFQKKMRAEWGKREISEQTTFSFLPPCSIIRDSNIKANPNQ